jgi:hypothetical protein
MSAMERSDMIESRADMAKAVLNILLVAMESDSPPDDGTVNKAIWAATELLSVVEVVA